MLVCINFVIARFMSLVHMPEQSSKISSSFRGSFFACIFYFMFVSEKKKRKGGQSPFLFAATESRSHPRTSTRTRQRTRRPKSFILIHPRDRLRKLSHQILHPALERRNDLSPVPELTRTHPQSIVARTLRNGVERALAELGVGRRY